MAGGFYVSWAALIEWTLFLIALGVVVILVGSAVVYGYSQRMMWYRVWTHDRYRILRNLDDYRSEEQIQHRLSFAHRGFDEPGGDAVRKGTIWYPMYLLGWWIAALPIARLERQRIVDEQQLVEQEA